MAPNVRATLFSIVGLGLVLRTACLIESQTNPLIFNPVLDEAYYIGFGRAVAAGFWLGEERVFFMDPLYGYFVGAIYFLFGESANAVRLLQVVIDTFNIFLVFIIGKKVADERSALFAAFIYATYKVAFFYTLLILKATLTVTFSLLFVLLAISVVEKKKITGWIILGVFTAISVWLRGNLLLFAPLTLLVYWQVKKPTVKTLAKNGAIYLATMALVLSLGGLRNYYVAGEWVTLNSQAGRLFYISNNAENLKGRYSNPSFFRSGGVGGTEGAEREFHAEAEKRVGRILTAKEVSSYWMGEGFSFLLNNPASALILVFNKVWWSLGDYEIPINLSYSTATKFSAVLAFPMPTFALVMALGVPGLFLATRKRRETLWLFVPLVTMAGTILIFYTSSRFRFPLVPFLSIGAGVSIALLYDWVKAKRLTKVAAISGFSLLLFIFSLSIAPPPKTGNEEFLLSKAYWKSADYNRAYEIAVEGTKNYPIQARFPLMLGILSISVNRYDDAIAWSQRAIEMTPHLADPHHNLGLAYIGKGEPAKAIESLEKAASMSPPLLTWYALGRAYQEAGRNDDAKSAYQKYLKLARPGDPLAIEVQRQMPNMP